ncbi:c-type cytochrome [Thauera propionica]|uniref:c-type cytochrome n=1 Tax=Thauera propionica TaxID=2019431 RepID=UPI0023F0E49B|nr:cytochrome c [Thauera propionica]MDD3675089.1 cytochrome c [Thauera propionica]
MRRTLGWLLLAVSVGTAASEPAPDGVDTRPRSGEKTWRLFCEGCHKPGPEAPGTRVLAARLGWDKAPLKGRQDLDPGYVKHVVRHGLIEMAPLRPTDITDEELDALIAYLREPASK